ncbi:NlpC/P60 family protein [Mucilaginibacter sp. PAMB04274]|uniref:C40 family peptidase n=1 Tax=Mucilaginibacter sp. PAMB04274 TaxID=3138568 RepID=UPI0031F61D85
MPLRYIILALAFLVLSCNQPGSQVSTIASGRLAAADSGQQSTTFTSNAGPITSINTGKTTPAQLVAFARTLTGITYKYGSVNPQEGFDCSGFITYTFNHFNIAVPRSSKDFTNVKEPTELKHAKPGDLILFTGTDSTQKVVGHMGIIVNAGDSISFIHATSGKQYGVTETPLNAYYQGRYLKTIRVFPQNH